MAKNPSVMADFYRVVLNQSLFDMKKVVDSLGNLNNDLLQPQVHEKDIKTIHSLISTYLGVCVELKKVEDANVK